ncbi:hypothetical protein H0H92_000608 [Tricholoma furcatifolium]|nr:hypothetical protein H0H92_000608 [Tricholoma furcatifolium]
MASTIEQRSCAVEREMSTHQRGLVDTCLEEGQFESAIALLEQLRSPNYKPAVSHIRQLVYIALQPEDPPPLNEMVYTDVPSSPSKAAIKKRIPSGMAVLAARRLLNSFAITNSPEAIAAALPYCGDPRKDEPLTQASDDGSLESVIGPQSMCIPKAKSCWSILSQGFTQRGQIFPLPSSKGNKRPFKLREEEDHPLHDIESVVVDENAWPVLDWLLTLFEQDEIIAENRETGRFSNLLLRQLPYPRSGTGPRWDTEAPLRIVFFCMEQAEVRYQAYGYRLMILLINLSATPHLDLPMFVASVCSRLTAAELERLPALLSNLGSSTAIHTFKVLLCQKLLIDANNGQTQGRNPKIQARARALRTTRTEENLQQSDTTTPAQQNAKILLPALPDIQRCLEMNTPSSVTAMNQSALLRVKYELFNSYGMLQTECVEKDSDWLSSLRDGRLNQIVDTVFRSNPDNADARTFRAVLQNIICVWYN